MLKSEIGLQMAELAHIEKIQKSANFWGSKLKKNINFYFWKNMNSPNDDEEDTWKQIHNLWRMVAMIRGRGIPQKYILDFDTNTNSLNYDDDEEKESKSNKHIY